MSNLSQNSRVLKLLKSRGQLGAYNYDLAKISLRYGARLKDLREDGYNIITERQYVAGRASNSFKYVLIEE